MEHGSIEDFESRFMALAEEAKGYGLSAGFVLVEPPGIGEVDTLACGFSGSYYAVLGGMVRFDAMIQSVQEV